MPIQSSGSRSAELAYHSSTYVAPEATIRPLRDTIIIEPRDVDHSQSLFVIEFTKPLRGIVRAVGPGHYPKIYDHPDKHKRSKMRESEHFQPTEIKVGDLVELGGLYVDGKINGYSFQQFMWGDRMHLICREADISGVVEEE